MPAPVPGWPVTAPDPEEDVVARRLVCAYVVLLLVVPSTTVLSAVGAAGFPAALLGLVAAGLYLASTLFGFHRPDRHRYPTRAAFIGLWLTSLCSYVVFQFRERTPIEVNGADRWLLFLLSITGIALVAAEGIRTVGSLLTVLRAATWAGAFCGAVAAVQFWFGYDLAAVIGSSIPGFASVPFDAIQSRGALNRVAGTTIHPIELGAVTSILLPIAVVLAAIDRHRPGWVRAVPVVLLAVCIPVSVSRSAVLGLAVVTLVFVAQLGSRGRLAAAAVVPLACLAVVVIVPGFLATISEFITGAASDPSITTRTDDYQMVARLVHARPLFGQGGGTYLPDDALAILDNSYLKWVVEFGLVGLVVLVVLFMALPVVTAVTLRRRTGDPRIALVATAFSAGLAASAVSAAAFDSLAFPAMSSLQALVIGLLGAAWQLGARTPRTDLLTDSADPEDTVDTLNVWRALRRNRWVVAGVLAAVALGTVWALAVRPMTYQTTSTVVVVPPPARPTDAELIEHPEWQGLNSDNPYARLYDPATITAMITYPLTAPAGRAAVQRAAGSRDYSIQEIYRYGFATPFVTVVATGHSAAEALATNRTVVSRLRAELEAVQRREPASRRYYITLGVASAPTAAATHLIEPYRPLLLVLGAGAVALFLGVGVGDAVRISRRQRADRALAPTAASGTVAAGNPDPDPDPHPVPLAAGRRT